MKISILADNNTIIDRYFEGEPGLSLYIKADNLKILFDTGYSDLFLRNAMKKGIDFSTLDHLIFSHGHFDHTWGLPSLIRYYTERYCEKAPFRKPVVIAHPLCFEPIMAEGNNIGSMLSKESVRSFFPLRLEKDSFQISENIYWLGEIPRIFDFEKTAPHNLRLIDGQEVPDELIDDSSLAIKTRDGLVIVTGCAHSGICNTVEYARKVTGEERILDIIGGFHLLNPSEESMEGTIEYFRELDLKSIHPCHCVSLKAKLGLASAVKIKEVGVGMDLEYPG